MPKNACVLSVCGTGNSYVESLVNNMTVQVIYLFFVFLLNYNIKFKMPNNYLEI